MKDKKMGYATAGFPYSLRVRERERKENCIFKFSFKPLLLLML